MIEQQQTNKFRWISSLRHNGSFPSKSSRTNTIKIHEKNIEPEIDLTYVRTGEASSG